jgi:hypothetical protein
MTTRVRGGSSGRLNHALSTVAVAVVDAMEWTVTAAAGSTVRG